jgi:iron(III) transport system permease protein
VTRTNGIRPPRPLIAAAVVSACLALIPLMYLIVRVTSAGPEKILSSLLRARTWETTATSVSLMVVVVVGCLIIAIPAAALLTRTNLPGRRLWLTALALPLAIPSYVAAYAWLAQFPAMSGFWAAALILIAVSYPYVLLPVAAALRSTDPAIEEVARSLGRSPFAAFRTTTLPQAIPAAAAGSLLVGLYVLSDFGAVSLFRVDAFTRVIFASYRASFDRTSAAVLASILVLLALILVFAERKVRGRSLQYRSASGTQRMAVLTQLTTRGRLLGWGFVTTVIAIAIVVPVTSLLIRLVEGSRRPLDVMELVQATVSSAGAAAGGAVIAVALALPIGLLTARYRSKWSTGTESAAFAGHALPGVVIGLSLVFLTINAVPFLYQTLFTLAFAYAVLFLPKSIGATRTSIAAVPPILEQTARTLGRNPLGAWANTTLRLAWPGIAAGGLLVLLTAMKELPATLMLRPTGFDTLATELWSRTEIAAYGAAAPYALALIALAAVPAFALSLAMSKGQPEQMEDQQAPTQLDTVST